MIELLPEVQRVRPLEEIASPAEVSSSEWPSMPPIVVENLGERALAVDTMAPFTAVSGAQRQRLYDKAANAMFVGTDEQIYRVPHSYPDDKCFIRGHLSALLMMEEGINPAKIFAVSRDTLGYDRLRARTDHAPDMSVDAEPSVRWAFHTAAAAYGDDEGFWVIDPATQPGPVRSEKWLHDISDGVALEFWPLDRVQAHHRETRGRIAPGDAHYYFTDARALMAHDAGTINSLVTANLGVRNCLSDLTRVAKAAEVRELAALGRQILRGERPPMALSAVAATTRDQFGREFPLLSGALHRHFGGHALGNP